MGLPMSTFSRSFIAEPRGRSPASGPIEALSFHFGLDFGAE